MRLDIEISKDLQQDMDELPIEAAHLPISIPMIYTLSLLRPRPWLDYANEILSSGIEVTLFLVGMFSTGGLSGLNTLVVDTHQESPATANGLQATCFGCLISADATAIIVPLIDKMAIGWTCVFIAGE